MEESGQHKGRPHPSNETYSDDSCVPILEVNLRLLPSGIGVWSMIAQVKCL